MNESSVFRVRIYFTVLVTLAIASLLAWNYTHGGVPSHHILADENLPEISNWWGMFVLPLLTWFLTYRIEKRIFRNEPDASRVKKQLSIVLFGFIGALTFGILLSVFFRFGYNEITDKMMLIIFPLALFVPLYRSEYLLGFVIGMTFTFGAILPTGVGSILTLICAILYLYVRAGFLFIVSKLSKK